MTTDQTKSSFYMLGKPLSLIDAINRRAAAQGSVRYAMMAADADYNGHHLSLYWNDYRRYYVLDYHWGERVVIHRGTDFVKAIDAAKREMARQGRGATLSVVPRDEADAAIARADDSLIEGRLYDLPYPYHPSDDAWKFAEISTASLFRTEHLLITAKSRADYEAAVKKYQGR